MPNKNNETWYGDDIRRGSISDEFGWRIFRIMSEFVEGFQLIRELKNTVSIFGSARFGENNKHYKEARLLVVVLIACAITTLLFNVPQFPLSLRLRSGHALHNSTFIQNRTDSGLNLLAFRLENNQYRPGDFVDLTLYWQAQRFLSENYQTRVSMVNNRDGSIGDQTPLHYPGNYPTRRWKTGFYVTDGYHLHLPLEIVPGNYQINVQVYSCNPDCASSKEVTFFNINGQVLGTNLTLPTLITVSD